MTESPSASAHVAARVRQLRQHAGMSGSALADRLREQGLNWNRSTVAKMETGLRESISVDELTALAKVFRVPAANLLGRACDHCIDNPPHGYTCNHCGMIG